MKVAEPEGSTPPILKDSTRLEPDIVSSAFRLHVLSTEKKIVLILLLLEVLRPRVLVKYFVPVF
jgi:hypothetical protein